jgi:iron complex outermembrane recepter protein
MFAVAEILGEGLGAIMCKDPRIKHTGGTPASSHLTVQAGRAAAIALCLGGLGEANAQSAAPPSQSDPVEAPRTGNVQAPNPSAKLPPIVVNPPAQKQTKRPTKKKVTAQATETTPASQTGSTESAAAGGGNGDSRTPSQQAPELGKTGTPLADLPVSVQIIPRQILNEQGAITLSQSVTNASGVNVGGQDSKGYFDHFLIRGLNAQIFNDGFSDGDQLGGIPHSLNGVRRIEILEGPGSALFGSGPPGGTINVVHYVPSSEFHYGDTLQIGSFGTVTDSFYVTGPTTINGLDYRVDATVGRSDGFRDLASRDYELRPEFRWNLGGHTVDFSLDMRHIEQTPDSYGIIYLNGQPIKNVSIDAKYSTPFAFAKQDYIRPTAVDKWVASDFLTINNRFSYLYRSSDVLANGDSTSTKVSGGEVVGRQLREQDDIVNTFDYQFEPVWKFATSGIQHTLLTGFEYQRQTMATSREAADLPNIVNAFAPVPPEMSLKGITFLCDSKHSCDDDRLAATYVSLYATDQIDVTDKFKIRVGVRQDWWDTALTPLITVPLAGSPGTPGRFTSQGTPLLAGVTQTQDNAPVSWNAGALYKVFPWASPYFGISKSFLTNFNSENTQNGIGAPESALQYEAGIKFSFLNDRIVLNTAAFNVSRDNVATAVAVASINGGQESVVFDSQKTEGFEASLNAKVTDRWSILANVTAQDAVVTNNPQGIAAVGNHPQGVPAYMANLWTTYKFPIAGLDGFQIGGGLNYRDKTYSDITNVNSIPAYVIGNAMFGYEGDGWGVSLNVKNFTNERYYLAANAAGAFVGEPLSAIVSFRIKN